MEKPPNQGRQYQEEQGMPLFTVYNAIDPAVNQQSGSVLNAQVNDLLTANPGYSSHHGNETNDNRDELTTDSLCQETGSLMAAFQNGVSLKMVIPVEYHSYNYNSTIINFSDI